MQFANYYKQFNSIHTKVFYYVLSPVQHQIKLEPFHPLMLQAITSSQILRMPRV